MDKLPVQNIIVLWISKTLSENKSFIKQFPVKMNGKEIRRKKDAKNKVKQLNSKQQSPIKYLAQSKEIQ